MMQVNSSIRPIRGSFNSKTNNVVASLNAGHVRSCSSRQQQRARTVVAAAAAAGAAAVRVPPPPFGCSSGMRPKLVASSNAPSSSKRPLHLPAAALARRAPPSRGPDLLLPGPPNAPPIAVFGVEHTERQPHIGEWVLATRPAAVVVETACNPAHGSAPGNVFSCADPTALGAGGSFFERMFCQLAGALEDQGDAAFAPGGVWAQAAANLNGEQLAYVAALATGAELAFGDRPKNITYRRLYGCTSLQQLDAAYAREVLRQYLEVLGERADAYPAANTPCPVDDVMMAEREAVMCAVAWGLAEKHSGGGNGGESGSGSGSGAVALVVGSAHLPGIERLWTGGAWRAAVGGGGGADLAASPLMRAPDLTPADMAAPGAGARRGLLDAWLALNAPVEVLADLESNLPPIGSPEEEEARAFTYEFYSAQRVQLSTLPRALLDKLVSTPRGGSGGNGNGYEGTGEDYWDALEPLRAARPAGGGPGYDLDLVMALRALDLHISVDEDAKREAAEEAANNNAAAAAAAAA